MWGGRTEDFSERKSELASSVHSFDQFLELWAENESSGVPPPGLYNGTCASAGHHVYVYGGSDGSHRYSSLYQLDTRSWTWKQLSSAGPMKKDLCGMVAHDSKLVLFGGYGTLPGPTQPGAEFVKDGNYTSGWTNELRVFDLNKGMGECILLSILQHTLHAWYRASFCHRNGGHSFQCLQPYQFFCISMKTVLQQKMNCCFSYPCYHPHLPVWILCVSTQGTHWIQVLLIFWNIRQEGKEL